MDGTLIQKLPEGRDSVLTMLHPQVGEIPD